MYTFKGAPARPEFILSEVEGRPPRYAWGPLTMARDRFWLAKLSPRARQINIILPLLCMLMSTGCAGSISRWIVNTRVHQGDVALERGNVRDAELSYRLALRIAPEDPRAKLGYVQAAAGLAQAEYTKADFEGALETIKEGLAIDPQSVRLDALKTTIEQAKLRSEEHTSELQSQFHLVCRLLL